MASIGDSKTYGVRRNKGGAAAVGAGDIIVQRPTRRSQGALPSPSGLAVRLAIPGTREAVRSLMDLSRMAVGSVLMGVLPELREGIIKAAQSTRAEP